MDYQVHAGVLCITIGCGPIERAIQHLSQSRDVPRAVVPLPTQVLCFKAKNTAKQLSGKGSEGQGKGIRI